MNRFYYDFHIHSALSPCGDNDSTPDSIAGMGELNGLDVMALTDHNSAKNCPAFFEAAKRHGIIPIAGLELNTSEEIHMICLFEFLDDALKFDDYLQSRRVLIKNRSDIFGEQLIFNHNDVVIGEEENLLINATTISLDELPELMQQFGGLCYPAHIDRESNGIISVLGDIPQYPKFNFFEIHDRNKIDEYSKSYNIDKNRFIISSDAHYIWDIKEKDDYISLNCDKNDEDTVRKKLFEYLRSTL